MSCDFLYSTDGIWLLSCSIYVISDMTDTWECKYSALGLTGAQTQVRRQEPCPIVWNQHGRMDVVLASVVVTPGPGMIMFSLKGREVCEA